MASLTAIGARLEVLTPADIAKLLEAEKCPFRGVAKLRTGASEVTYVDGSPPPDPRTEFQIASVSKQLTAAAILRLQEAGRLSVEDRLDRWFPECGPAWRPVSIHQLLTHTSGMGHWNDYPDLDLFEPRSDEDVLAAIFAGSPLTAPGERWYYSSPGFVLLAHMVERAAGYDYSDFLDDSIFKPLGMRRSRAGQHAPVPESEATGHSCGAPTRSFELDHVGKGAGDVWSTADDLLLWDQALMDGSVLSPASVKAMLTPHSDAIPHRDPSLRAGYGYGWYLETLGGHRVAYHLGGNAGFGAFNAIALDDQVSLAIVADDDSLALEPAGISLLVQALVGITT